MPSVYLSQPQPPTAAPTPSFLRRQEPRQPGTPPFAVSPSKGRAKGWGRVGPFALREIEG